MKGEFDMIVTTIALFVAVLAFAVGLAVLITKGFLSVNFAKVDGALADIEVDNPIFDRLIEYVRQAVYAAEQKYKTGQITAEERKCNALQMVETFAQVDGVEMTCDMQAVEGDMIEVECCYMGHEIIE